MDNHILDRIEKKSDKGPIIASAVLAVLVHAGILAVRLPAAEASEVPTVIVFRSPPPCWGCLPPIYEKTPAPPQPIFASTPPDPMILPQDPDEPEPLSVEPDTPVAETADAGVEGGVEGGVALAALANVGLTALARQSVTAPDPEARLVERLEARIARAFPVLTLRERQVAARTVAGWTAERTAAALDIRPSSVLTYRQRAYQRLGFSGTADFLPAILD